MFTNQPGELQTLLLLLQIISAGNEPFVHHWSVNGEERSKVPCSPTSVFSLRVNNTSENAKVRLGITGLGNINIYTSGIFGIYIALPVVFH